MEPTEGLALSLRVPTIILFFMFLSICGVLYTAFDCIGGFEDFLSLGFDLFGSRFRCLCLLPTWGWPSDCISIDSPSGDFSLAESSPSYVSMLRSIWLAAIVLRAVF
jgi:hypothetical protein